MDGARGVLLVLAMLAANASAAVGGVTAAAAVFVVGWIFLLLFLGWRCFRNLLRLLQVTTRNLFLSRGAV